MTTYIEEPVRAHYDAVSSTYHRQYERDGLHDLCREYPANYFRLQMLLNTFVSNGVKRVIEVGVGEGTPLATLGNAGIRCWGFDLSPEMVQRSRDRMRDNGMDPDHIFQADIQDPVSYASAFQTRPLRRLDGDGSDAAHRKRRHGPGQHGYAGTTGRPGVHRVS